MRSRSLKPWSRPGSKLRRCEHGRRDTVLEIHHYVVALNFHTIVLALQVVPACTTIPSGLISTGDLRRSK